MNSKMWLVCPCLVGCVIVSILADPGDPKIVTIDSGKISGVEGKTDDNGITLWAFLGIPYAAPPLGDLRFKPPQPVQPWEKTLDASTNGCNCLQDESIRPTSENCLFINVYTTNLNQNSTLLPVMVFIHGGGFSFGSGSFGVHGADRFLNNGVVLVSFNYRLGVFGFLCTSDGASPGNYGLKDQIAALKWVQNNIAVFGGDPNRTTVFGESAGAASVHYLLQTNLTKGLYQAAISQSGSTLSTWAVARDPRDFAFQVGQSNLIFTKDSAVLVNKLRRVNALQLHYTSSVLAVKKPDEKDGLAWSPCIEQTSEQAVVTEYSYGLLDSGYFNRVPLLTGFNSLEARDVNALAVAIYLYSVEYILIPKKFVPEDMHAVNASEAGAKIRTFYFGSRPVRNNTDFIKYASDSLFVRGINKHVQLMSKYVPVYYYRFAFIGGSSHLNFKPQGVAHAEELQFLFNTPFDRQVTPEAKLTAERLVKLWTNFATYYNPTPVQDPVFSNITWPVAIDNSTDISYMNIDTNLTVGTNPESTEMQFWDNLYQGYGVPPYNNY